MLRSVLIHWLPDVLGQWISGKFPFFAEMLKFFAGENCGYWQLLKRQEIHAEQKTSLNNRRRGWSAWSNFSPFWFRWLWGKSIPNKDPRELFASCIQDCLTDGAGMLLLDCVLPWRMHYMYGLCVQLISSIHSVALAASFLPIWMRYSSSSTSVRRIARITTRCLKYNFIVDCEFRFKFIIILSVV